LNIQLLVLPLFSTSSQVLYFEDDYVMEVELAIHIYVDKWPMTCNLIKRTHILTVLSCMPLLIIIAGCAAKARSQPKSAR
jgi:hypothetical protein